MKKNTMIEAVPDFSEENIQQMLDNLDVFSQDEVAEIDRLVDEIAVRKQNTLAYDDLIEFCKRMMPEFLVGKHHRILANMLMSIEVGDKDRVCVNIPPRHGKSQLVSIFFPAWYLGRNPNKKVMMVSHTTDLAVDFGRKVRNLIATPDYRSIFPTVKLAVDSKSAGRWNTSVGGEYYACGVGSALAGRGADLLLIDDPHSEQDVISERSDQFEVIEFPAILEIEDKKTKKVVEKPLWPEFFDLEALKRTKASMPTFQWNAQYQQQPTAEEAALVKREWWNIWEGENPPSCEYVIMSLDAAAEKHNRADYTALTTWGVFLNEETSAYNIILLNSIKQRMEFHELKEMAMQEYTDWEPDSFIVEKKSSGVALYQEMRRMGLPVSEYTPHRGSGDKLARLNSVSDIVQSRLCWVPPSRWAEEVVEEIAGFPFMSHDDLVDSTVMALMRFRQGGFIRLPSDEPEEQQYFKQRRGGYY